MCLEIPGYPSPEERLQGLQQGGPPPAGARGGGPHHGVGEGQPPEGGGWHGLETDVVMYSTRPVHFKYFDTFTL